MGDVPADLHEAAAFWAVRLSAEPSVADLEAFDAWIARDPAHLHAFNNAEDALAMVADHSTSPELLAMRSEALERARRVQRQRWIGGAALDRRQLVAAAAGVIAVPLGAAWWFSRKPAGQILTTGVGEQRTITLADGTRVTMDAMSRLRVDYSRQLRLLELTAGRAYFEVAKDAARPLRVFTGERSVTALGTAFSVESDPGAMLVTLVEGRVAVLNARAAQPIHLQPHQSLQLSDRGAPVLTDGVDAGRALAWREGRVVFDDVDLAQAVARMNTYSRTPIVIEESATGPKLASLRISGVFAAGDSATFAEALKAYFQVSVVRSTAAITLRRGPGQAS